jgi:hypothetical protein
MLFIYLRSLREFLQSMTYSTARIPNDHTDRIHPSLERHNSITILVSGYGAILNTTDHQAPSRVLTGIHDVAAVHPTARH